MGEGKGMICSRGRSSETKSREIRSKSMVGVPKRLFLDMKVCLSDFMRIILAQFPSYVLTKKLKAKCAPLD